MTPASSSFERRGDVSRHQRLVEIGRCLPRPRFGGGAMSLEIGALCKERSTPAPSSEARQYELGMAKHRNMQIVSSYPVI